MITVNMGGFIDEIDFLTRQVGITLDQAMSWQMALCVRTIIERIATDQTIKPGQAQYNFMAKRIGFQVDDIFSKLQESAVAFTPRSASEAGYQGIKNESGAVWLVPSDHYMPGKSISSLLAIHQQYRDKTGNVNFSPTDTAHGKWKVSGKYAARQDQIEQVKRAALSHIGRGKAAWFRPLDYFAQKSAGLAKWQPPAWVRRHQTWGFAHGSYFHTWDNKAKNGTWVARSDLAWGNNPRDVVKFAVGLRIKDIYGPWMRKKLEGIFKKFSAKRMAA